MVRRAIVLGLVTLFACGCHGGSAPAVAPPLATVAPVPRPTLASFVREIHPLGTVDRFAQIRVVFRNDLVPLEALETPREAAILAAFQVSPAIPGRFRFLTPRMIGFQSDAGLPPATRLRITIARGLTDRTGAKLTDDLSWTFDTGAIAISGLPGQEDVTAPLPASALQSPVALVSNVELDRDSLVQHASLVPESGGSPVGLVWPQAAVSPSPQATPTDDPGRTEFSYLLVPAAPLAKGTTYTVVIDAGVRPARGNRASESAFRGRLRTFGPLQFANESENTDGSSRFQSGTPTLRFSNPIDATSTAAAIRISPAPKPGKLVGSFDDPAILSLNPALLEPNTEYTVTLASTLADTFGQTLGHDERATFRTSDLRPQFWAPTGSHVFPSTAEVRLNLSAVNVPTGDARAHFVRLQASDVILNDDPSDETSPIFARGDGQVLATGARPNVERTLPISLDAALGAPAGVLGYTIAAKTGTHAGENGARVPDIANYAGLVQLTNLGVFAQYFPDTGFVRVDRIADGTPVVGAQVEVFRSHVGDKVATSLEPPCASARTEADGIARLSGSAFARCAALDRGQNQSPALVTIVRDGADWTYVRTDEYAGAYDTDLYAGWSSGTPQSRATIFSDRQLYQPGETVALTAVGWFLTHGRLARGSAPSYTVELRRPDNTTLELPRLTLNAFGTGSLTLALPKPAVLGYYTVHAHAGNGEEFSGSFRVAEFKPPNFKVDLALDRPTALAGETVSATSVSTYLFGAPVQAATTTYHVTRSIANYVWPKDDAYSFGRAWFWPEEQPSVATDVKNASVATDAGGKTTLAVPVAADLPYPMTYRVDADTTDVANITVGGTATLTAFPGPTLVGLKTSFIATAGAPAAVSVVALDAHGVSAPNTKIHLDLQAAKINEATQVVEGSDTAEQSVTYTTVASADATSGTNAIDVSLTPPQAGSYRIRANIAGATSDATETDVQLFVAGPGEGGWGTRDPSRVVVHLDRAKYHIGDTARAIVQSPFPDADLIFAVIRNGVLWQQRVRTTNRAPVVAFPILPAMLPNAAFEVVAVRRGKLPASDAADGGNTLSRTGFAGFEVATDGMALHVKATPDRTTLRPAAQQSVHLHITAADGHAVRGAVTLIVANDAILQLSGYRPPDLVQLVYADQPISTRFADSRKNVVLRALKMAQDKGWGFGGGVSAGAEDTRIRHNFQPLAFYAPSVLTDANGDARVAFALPDDLTTWRIMAVAATTDGRFGNGEATFMTAKPLIASPVVPQFARPGDRFDAGLTLVGPASADAGTLAIAGRLSAPLSFLENGAQHQTTTLEAPLDRLTHAYRFSMLATGSGTSTATFSATLAGKSGTAADGFAIPVEITDRAVTESVITTGVTTTDLALPFAVASAAARDTGGLTLSLANSLLPDVLVAARASLHDRTQLAFLAAGRISVAADALQLLPATGDRKAGDAFRQQAIDDLAFVRSQQRADGGFTAYPSATVSDPFDSLDVLRALTRAVNAKLPVDAGAFAQAKSFAAVVLADPSAWKWCKKDPCKSVLRLHALEALAESGDRRTTSLGEIDRVRAQLGLADQLRLARYLLAAPGYESQGAQEAAAFGERVYQTGAQAVFNTRYRWYSEPTVLQSLALRLALAQKSDGETLDRLTRSLLALRRNGTWGCACENAAALDALVDLAKRAGPPANYTLTPLLRGTTIPAVTFAGSLAQMAERSVPAAKLAAGESQLSVKKSAPGALHYALTYTYRLTGDQPGRLNGIRVTRIVHPAGSASQLASLGLALPTSPLTLETGHVFDIELQIATDHAIDRVAITDPLPAGLEAVDTSFSTSTQSANTMGDGWQIENQQIHHDRIEAYADRLPAGVYVMHYIARSVTPGTFRWPGAEARLSSAPEEFGRTASTMLIVK